MKKQLDFLKNKYLQQLKKYHFERERERMEFWGKQLQL
jgi:hypothetical protein